MLVVKGNGVYSGLIPWEGTKLWHESIGAPSKEPLEFEMNRNSTTMNGMNIFLIRGARVG